MKWKVNKAIWQQRNSKKKFEIVSKYANYPYWDKKHNDPYKLSEKRMKKFEELMSVKNEIENISAAEAKEKLNDPNVQFIDVRDKESFSKGTIGNAIHMDRGLLEFYLAEGSPLENDIFKNNPDKEFIVFCGLGGQGTLATKTMKDMGVKNVKNISGGMSEWEKLKD